MNEDEPIAEKAPDPEPHEVRWNKLSDLNQHIRIYADPRDIKCGNGSHAYTVEVHSDIGIEQSLFFFQKGALKEVGINGVSDEALLAILIDRLQGFQTGPFSCRENALALTKLEEAMHWLNHRTLDRMNRGVEGISKA